jgi:hypothetical protein
MAMPAGTPRPSANPPPTTGTVEPSCAAGYAWNGATGRCDSTNAPPPHCQGGYSYQASLGLCVKSEPASCPTGYRLDTVRGVCSTGAVAQ